MNIVENQFLNEFRVAQANLAANIAAGRGNTYAFTGVPGTGPLPIHLAYLNGRSDANNPAAYTHANFTNQAFYSRLSSLEPNVTGQLAALDSWIDAVPDDTDLVLAGDCNAGRSHPAFREVDFDTVKAVYTEQVAALGTAHGRHAPGLSAADRPLPGDGAAEGSGRKGSGEDQDRLLQG